MATTTPLDPVATKPADAAKKPEKNVATDKSAMDILDPKKPAMEAPVELEKEEALIGDSYPTDEALQAEREAAEKMANEKAKKDLEKNEVRSSIDPTQTSVIHPGAKK